MEGERLGAVDAEQPPSPRRVAHEQADAMTVGEQPPGDRLADQTGRPDNQDPLEPQGSPARGPNRRSM